MGSYFFEVLEFIILALFVRAMARNLGSLFRSPRNHVRTTRSAAPTPPSAEPHRAEMARDPVCGMFVSTELSYQLKRGAETLHFCSEKCQEKYQKDTEHVAS